MGTKAESCIERSIDVQSDRRSELVHWFPLHADKERESVTMLFDADAPGDHRAAAVRAGAPGGSAAPDAILHILNAQAFVGALRKMNHSGSVQSNDGLF